MGEWDLVAQWLSAVGDRSDNTGSNPCSDGQQDREYTKRICCPADKTEASYFSRVKCKVK